MQKFAGACLLFTQDVPYCAAYAVAEPSHPLSQATGKLPLLVTLIAHKRDARLASGEAAWDSAEQAEVYTQLEHTAPQSGCSAATSRQLPMLSRQLAPAWMLPKAMPTGSIALKYLRSASS